jgi:hypothetical protein
MEGQDEGVRGRETEKGRRVKIQRKNRVGTKDQKKAFKE